MRKTGIVLWALLFATVLHSDEQTTYLLSLLPVHNEGATAMEAWGRSVAKHPTEVGSTYVAGAGYFPLGPQGEDMEFFLTKRNAAGQELWTRTYGEIGRRDFLRGMTVTPYRHIFLSGYARWGGPEIPYHRFIYKLDLDGNVLCSVDASPHMITSARKTVENADGSFFVTGTIAQGYGGDEFNATFSLNKYNARCEELWSKTYDERFPAGAIESLSGMEHVGGALVLAGYLTDAQNYTWQLLVHLDLQGNLLKVQQINMGASYLGTKHNDAMAVLADWRVVTAGADLSLSGPLTVFGPGGAGVECVYRHHNPNFRIPYFYGIVADPQGGGFFATGSTQQNKLALVSVSSSCQERWVKIYDSPAPSNYGAGYSLATDGSHLHLTGMATSPTRAILGKVRSVDGSID